MPHEPPAPWLTPGAIATADCILSSFHRAFGRPLIAAAGVENPTQRAQELFAAPLVVLAHDASPLDQGDGPQLIYGNRAALSLWCRNWAQLVGLHSKLTAEPAERASRQAALSAAQQQSAISGYSGIRTDRHGRRFKINGANLWCLWSPSGDPCGQAACFSDWWWL
ncbi:MEKHLA domain-containing protein [Cyanobium sp. HWJ4-Hawea]|uniref:MEKHLA domain-containing protein n=1 Tax=Cyanobium sp. HWJ4-Hawea TaxID=2823713 RepID=UPI0020CFDEB6|nr:MEKHLA domain-containing protein [Cyanobium sp. HWJ4-Hawea]MCP9808182.1 MEKHLA domain-containing protein [Cyanobium sp. HWJ4-Hawea]